MGTGATQIVILAAAPKPEALQDFQAHLAEELRQEFKDFEIPKNYSSRFDQRGVIRSDLETRAGSHGENRRTNEAPERTAAKLPPVVLGVAFSY